MLLNESNKEILSEKVSTVLYEARKINKLKKLSDRLKNDVLITDMGIPPDEASRLMDAAFIKAGIDRPLT